MRKILENKEIFRERRAQLARRIPGAAMIVPAYPEMLRNYDVEQPYRADSNLYYLTGFEEPGAILLFRPGQNPETILFVRPKDVERETWDGFRFGPDYAKDEFGIDQTYLVSDFEKLTPALLQDVDRVYYRVFQHPQWDVRVSAVLENARGLTGRSGKGLLPIFDPIAELGEMRLIKSAVEIENQKRACDISAEGHLEVMRRVKPGMSEREVHGLFLYRTMQLGSPREGYYAIVAGGPSACTLHYRFNDQVLVDGDLLLIDAGAEYRYYTGDITRTYPVNGRFSEPQRRVYEAVLQVQTKLIDMVRPGVRYAQIREKTVELLAEAMLELGLFTGTVNKVVESGDYRRYYPHGFGHWLGMDVHDRGLYTQGKDSRVFEPGMCLTVEPGLYIPAGDLSAPKELRGIGVRIEDDLLITAEGNEVLTNKAPKTVSELENIIGSEL